MTISGASHARGGFTLIEVLIAVSIGIAVIAGSFWGINRAWDELYRYRVNSALGKIELAINQYRISVQKVPKKLDELVKGPKEELDRKRWVQGGGPFLDEVPLDPWGNKYVYKPTPGAKKAYEIYSYGPTGPGAPKIEHISVGG